jgi:hypothetical protein
MYETIQCPFCGEHHAHITYEENGVYQLNCTECHHAIFHQDSSWDSAVKFFKGLFIVENAIIDKFNSIGCTSFTIIPTQEKPIKVSFEGDVITNEEDKFNMNMELLYKIGKHNFSALDCSDMSDEEIEKILRGESI